MDGKPTDRRRGPAREHKPLTSQDWMNETMRLNHRIRDLESDNARLRAQVAKNAEGWWAEDQAELADWRTVAEWLRSHTEDLSCLEFVESRGVWAFSKFGGLGWEAPTIAELAAKLREVSNA